jgi:lipopolysaccharide/colanic/teichoic acid biosynthesis glycosyltransferase
MKSKVYRVKPGLTGIGSIVFRDEELIITKSSLPPHECYRQVILPYKGAVEVWYQQHVSFYTDFMLLFLTAWSVISPNTNLVSKVFPSLPKREF